VTPDLTVSVIVAECDEAEVLHGGNLEEMGIHVGTNASHLHLALLVLGQLTARTGTESSRRCAQAGHLDFLGVSHPMHQEIILQGKYHAAQMGEELASGMTRSLSSMRQRCNKGEEQACIRVGRPHHFITSLEQVVCIFPETDFRLIFTLTEAVCRED
jgi:hypothetical protein